MPLHWHCRDCCHPPMEHPSSHHAILEGYGQALCPLPQPVIVIVVLVLPSSSFSSSSFDHHHTLPTGLLVRGIDPQHCCPCPHPQPHCCCCSCPCLLLLLLLSLPFSFACSRRLLIVASSAKRNHRCHRWHYCHRHVAIIIVFVIAALVID